MKKFSFLVMVALLLGTMASCNGNSESKDKTADTLATTLGEFAGNAFKANLQQSPETKDLENKEIMKGIEAMIDMDTTKNSQSYIYGLRLGSQIYEQLKELEEMGVKLDRKLIINELSKSLNSKDTIDFNDQSKMMAFQSKMQKMQEKMTRLMGKLVGEAGQKYINEQMKKDKDLKKTKSGIAYKVLKNGSGANFTDTTVDVSFDIKHISGKELHSTQGQTVPVNLKQAMPGFEGISEIIKLMKPGSKVLAIIPGKLAFGEMGNPQGGIAPNETLVFEITTVGVHKDEPMPQVQQQPQPQSYPGRPGNIKAPVKK